MIRLSQYVLALVLMIFTISVYAETIKPGFVVNPFSRSASLSANSSANVLVIAQNQTGVAQTITNSAPQIPNNAGITAGISVNTCGVLQPGESCAELIKLTSSNKPSSGNLNISICSFNGAFCSRIVKPITYDNEKPLGIFITPTNPTIANGTTQQFFAVALLPNLSFQNITTSATWSSSDPAKATISNTDGTEGLASAVAAGSSLISAKLAGVSGSTTLTITSPTLTSITVTPVNPSIANGYTEQFTATGNYSDQSTQDLTDLVTWSSSNQATATISNATATKGLATSKASGSTTITATLGAISGTTTLTVTAATLTSISVTPTNPSTAIYTYEQFSATGIYSDNSVKDITNTVTWSTQSAATAVISNQSDSKGKAFGVGEGSTLVKATLSGITGSTNIVVTAATLTGINISPTNARLPSGTNQQYTATGIYNNGRTQDITTNVTWQSSNANIATISNAPGFHGLAYGVSGGTTAISASLDNITDSTDLTVTSPTLLSITVTPANPTVANGLEQQFTATGTYSDSSTQDLTEQATWTSGTPSVAVISNADESQGLASTVSTGTSSIAATLSGVSGNTTLTVTAATLTAITVTPSNYSLLQGTSVEYKATGTFSDASTKDITSQATWSSSNSGIATISNALLTKGLATGIAVGSTTISATRSSITGNTSLSVINARIGDNVNGGVVACLDGGLNNLITANANNSTGITWGGNGTTTNAQSEVDGQANTTRIVNVLGAGISYAAGLCDAYEIDSAGNTPCVGGNTCYNDWFLPSINQLTCLRNNRNQINGFNKNGYWSSTEDSSESRTKAMFITFENSGHPPAKASKTESYPVRCVRLLNATP